MKRIALTLILAPFACFICAQTENPFKKLGYDVLVATSSKGEFTEFHDQSHIVEIGSVLYNTKTKEIVKILNEGETTIDITSATAAMSIDPLCEKYYWISPYVYCLNNPIKFIDPDGRDVVLSNYVAYKNGSDPYVRKDGLSRNTQAALNDYVKTKEGRAFIGQFAKAGDVIGGVEFAKDGALSKNILHIQDVSLSDENGQILPSGKYGSTSVSDWDGKKVVGVELHTKGMNKNDIGETMTHEMNLHGYKTGDKIAGKKTATEGQDHKALKSKDSTHKGYQQYQSVKKQLETQDPKYKETFKKKDEEYQKKY